MRAQFVPNIFVFFFQKEIIDMLSDQRSQFLIKNFHLFLFHRLQLTKSQNLPTIEQNSPIFQNHDRHSSRSTLLFLLLFSINFGNHWRSWNIFIVSANSECQNGQHVLQWGEFIFLVFYLFVLEGPFGQFAVVRVRDWKQLGGLRSLAFGEVVGLAVVG